MVLMVSLFLVEFYLALSGKTAQSGNTALSGHMILSGHTRAIITERDVQVTDVDLGHGVCVHIFINYVLTNFG